MRIGIVGAGAIGGYLAAEASAGGGDVVLVGRKGRVDPAALPVGVRLDGRVIQASRSMLLTDEYEALRDVEVCIVVVKSADTSVVGEALASVLPVDAPVASLQNGLGHAETLRRSLGDRVVGGVVTYNVYVDSTGRRRQATAGKLVAGCLPGALGARMRSLQRTFELGGETLELREDVDAILCGKLLVNLNNGVCAATGLGIAGLLADRDARWCFAQCLLEGLATMRAAGHRPARVTALPPDVLARALLHLPNPIVVRLARRLASVNADARGSTLQDLDKGRRTEIDELNGAIVAMASRAGRRAPVNALITEVVHDHERAGIDGQKIRFLPARELRGRIERARA